MERTVVTVTGLREFSRAVRRLDAEAAKAIRVALNGCATLLIDRARPKIPRRTGRAAASLKASSTRTAVRIKIGGPRAPWYPWLDFGGRTGRRKSVVRPFIAEGRYLYPTLAQNRAEFTQIMETALGDIARDVGLEIG